MFTQQTIQVVADHELNDWDYSFSNLTATVQFKSMKMSFVHPSIQACKEFQARLMEARKIFGKARIPADNLINALIDAGYKLVKTEVNRPSAPTIRDPGQSGPIAMLNNPKTVSELHNVPCGGTLASNQSYRVGEQGSPSVQLKHSQEALESAMVSVAPANSGVSNKRTVVVNVSKAGGDFADAIMKAFEELDSDTINRGR